jgi:hypothetical protein
VRVLAELPDRPTGVGEPLAELLELAGQVTRWKDVRHLRALGPRTVPELVVVLRAGVSPG